MKPFVAPGTRYVHEVVPGAHETAAAIGNAGVDAVSTPALVAHVEQACHLLVAPAYDAGEATVGTRVALDHVGPARVGAPVRIEAELVSREGRRLTFAVSVTQDGRPVMRGEHVRFVVDLERFAGASGAAPGRPPPAPAGAPPPRIDFWFDFNSPWCHLAAARIGAVARRHRAEIAWRPVHLARLAERIGGRRPLEENPAFVRWYRQDLADWADLAGLEVRYHPRFPLRPARALRAALAAAEASVAEPFVRGVMRGYWADGDDIEDLEVLERHARAAGLAPGAARAAATDPARRAALAANLDEAVAAGVFGVPTAVLDGRLFFGNDRLDLLERALSRRR